MAIAFDTAVDGSNATATSLTWSHTCTGSNGLLIVDVIGNTASDAITGVTYNSVAMTLVQKVSSAAGGSGRWIYQFILAGPATGSNNVVVSAGSSIFIAGHSTSYTGCAQTGQPNASNTNVSASASSLAVSVNATVANCWLVGSIKNDAGVGTAGASTTLRETSATGGMTTCDSNGTVATGGVSLTINGGSTAWSGIACAIAPPSTNAMFIVF